MDSIDRPTACCQPQTLFLSFSSTLKGLVQSSISVADLESGLFYFNVSRSYVFAPSPDISRPSQQELFQLIDQASENKREFILALYQVLLTLLTLAESEERVQWNSNQNDFSRHGLNLLLQKHQLDCVPLSQASNQVYWGSVWSITPNDFPVRVIR